MTDEISKLKKDNAELERKLAAAEAKLEDKMKHGLEQQAWDILEHLVKTPNPTTVRHIASHFTITKRIAHYHVDSLGKRGFISFHCWDYSMMEIEGQRVPMFVVNDHRTAFYVSHTPAA
ncbi:MAG TPA: hypothetical protein VIK53_17185 [Verrucomicrobiae bacterium]